MNKYSTLSTYVELEEGFFNSKKERFLFDLYKTHKGEITLENVLKEYEYTREMIPNINYWSINNRLYYTTDTEWVHTSLKKKTENDVEDVYLLIFGPDELENKKGKHFGKGIISVDEAYLRILNFVRESKEDVLTSKTDLYCQIYGDFMEGFNSRKMNGLMYYMREISKASSTLFYFNIGNSLSDNEADSRKIIIEKRKKLIKQFGFTPSFW